LARVFLGLGSNVGDRLSYLRQSVEALDAVAGVVVHTCSSIYETEPWGQENQPSFLNQIIEIYTDLDANVLLQHCRNIEKKLGRKKGNKWGSRIIDLDILLYGQMTMRTDTLQIPHPQLANRRFVLEPLAEIDASVIVPEVNKTVDILLKQCPDKKAVKLYNAE